MLTHVDNICSGYIPVVTPIGSQQMKRRHNNLKVEKPAQVSAALLYERVCIKKKYFRFGYVRSISFCVVIIISALQAAHTDKEQVTTRSREQQFLAKDECLFVVSLITRTKTEYDGDDNLTGDLTLFCQISGAFGAICT